MLQEVEVLQVWFQGVCKLSRTSLSQQVASSAIQTLIEDTTHNLLSKDVLILHTLSTLRSHISHMASQLPMPGLHVNLVMVLSHHSNHMLPHHKLAAHMRRLILSQ